MLSSHFRIQVRSWCIPCPCPCPNFYPLPLRMRSVENHRLAIVHEYAVVDVPPHRARQDHLFQVATLFEKVFQPVAVRNTDDVLLDNRPLVEILRCVVARRADELYPALECPVVGLAPVNAGRKE